MPAFLERLNTYNNLTDTEKKNFLSWMADLMPSGIDYKFYCEPIKSNLPKSFMELWKKYPENPTPNEYSMESLNQWRNKIADELSVEKIGYLPPEDRLARYGSIDGKKFTALLKDLQVLSNEEFQNVDIEVPKELIDMWKKHPENFSPNADPIITLTKYCKKINDEIRNPDKYANPKSKPVLSKLSEEAKEALRVPPPNIMYPTHTFLNTAAFDYNLKTDMQNEFAKKDTPATIKDYVLVRATNDFPINGYHTLVNQNTRISMSKSFLDNEIVSFHYCNTKHFSINGLTQFASHGGIWSKCDFNIIEPLSDYIHNSNLISLHPRRYIF